MSALLCAYLLTSAAILHDPTRVVVTAVVVALLALLFAPHGDAPPVWVAIAAGGVAVSDRRFTSVISTGAFRTPCATT